MAGVRPSIEQRATAWEERALDRVRQQALQRGRRIVVAARRLVAAGGVEALTLRALLERSGLARRAFYRHFASMDDVLLALFEDTVAVGTVRLREQLAGIDDPIAALERAVRTIASGALSSPQRTFHLAMTQQHVRLAEQRPDELRAAHAPMNELIADLLRSGIEAKLVRDSDPSRMAEMIHGLVSTEVHRNLYRGAEDDAWIDALWEFCLGGIARAARRRRQRRGVDG